METEEQVEGPELGTLPIWEFARTNSKALRDALAIALLIAVGAFAFGFLIALIGRIAGAIDENPLAWPFTTAYLAVPLAVALFGFGAALASPWLLAALEPLRTRRTRPRAEAADELERIFADLVRLEEKRLVIVVDDVDRLAPDEVLRALATVKTLQAVPRDRPPIFVIACDEGIVRRAIQDADPGPAAVHGSERIAADEYLNKLFAVRQALPPSLGEDMRAYAERLLSAGSGHAGGEALGSARSDVLDVLIHGGVRDPRHVIRLLNAFFADYRLARVREKADGRLGPGEVTERPLLLARLTVLRVDFQRAYDAVRREFDLLGALDQLVLGGELGGDERRTLIAAFPELQEEVASDGEPAKLSVAALDGALADFLRRTARYVEPNVPLGPFFYLGQTVAGRTLGSERASEIRRALENNDVEAVRRQVANGDADLASATAAHIRDTLRRARPGLALTNVVATSAAALSSLPPPSRSPLANEIAMQILREPTAIPSPLELAEVIRSADPTHTPGLTGRLLEFEVDPSAARTRAEAVLGLASERPSDSRLARGLESYFDRLPQTTGWAGAADWIDLLASVDDAAQEKLVSPSFVSAMLLASVGAADQDIDDEASQRLAALVRKSPSSLRSSDRVLSAIRDCASSEGREPRLLAVTVLEELAPPSEDVPSFVELVAGVVNDEEVDDWSETRQRAVRLIGKWATAEEYRDALRMLPDPALSSLLDAVAATASADTPESVEAGADAVCALSGLLQLPVDPIVERISAALEKSRSTDVGRSQERALLCILSTANEATADALGEALFSPLDSTGLQSEPGRSAAIDSVAVAGTSDAGRALITRRLPRWVSVYSSSVSTPEELDPQRFALRSAAFAGAFPASKQSSFLERLRQLVPQGGAMTRAAVSVLATVPWSESNQPIATAGLADAWDSLDESEWEPVFRLVSAWPPEGELDAAFGDHVASYVLGKLSSGLALDWLHPLWPSLPPGAQIRLAAEGAGNPEIAKLVQSLHADELKEALSRAGEPFDLLVEAARAMPPDRAGLAAAGYLEGAFDATEVAWHDANVQAAVDLLDAAHAAGPSSVAVRHLQGAALEAGHAASLLGWLREKFPDDVDESSPILKTIQRLLPDASPDLAGRLGAASRGMDLPESVEQALREMRKQKDDQALRQAAEAFDSGRRR